MEQEYKWQADDQKLSDALLWASSRMGTQSQTYHMQSSYYDSPAGELRQAFVALRLRRENEKSICCMKLKNTSTAAGMRAHEEYECEAESLADGLRGLAAAGAPQDILAQCAALPLQVTCTVDFTRVALLLTEQNTVCELALDSGTLQHDGRSAPLCEIELEHKIGSMDAFHKLAAALADHLHLIPEPKSKLARALAL